ncbi:MAG: A/G-specific adenine glycosylase [Bacteroidota bacterium]
MPEFQSVIISWYQENKRDLPWRRTKNPYFIWLSEVILQQTRVVQGMSYFEKFLKKYPKIEILAAADEQEVLATWQGLGYYSRARNLHATAKQITNNFNGIFPSDHQEILKLKGVGEYTAAAIAAFAFDKAHAVVDGNVFRVLSRVFNLNIPIDSTEGKKQFTYLANELLDKNHPALFNQAIMEFGALQCVPGTPNCEICPLLYQCEAFKSKTVTLLPVKKVKTKIRNRYFLYFVQFNPQNQTLLLRQKTENDIWKNMFEFPKIEFDSTEKMQEYCGKNMDKILKTSTEYKHILSHQHLYAQFILCSDLSIFQLEDCIEIQMSELGLYPLPRLIDRFLSQNQDLLTIKP